MANSFVAYQNPGVTDKKLDSESLLVGVNTVERERVEVTGTVDAAIADVVNTQPASNAYGLQTREIPYKLSDYDSGVGIDNIALVGISVPASGGARQGGTLSDPIRVDPTGTTTQPVSGTVTATPVKSSTSTVPAQTTVTIDAQILAANASRRRAIIQNTGTQVLKLALGQTAAATAYHIALAACSLADAGDGGIWTDDMWTGAIRAIGAGAGTTCVITELT